MREFLRSQFGDERPTTLVVLGLSLSTTGTLTASGAADIGIGTALGTVLLLCGVVVLCGAAVVMETGDGQTGT